MTGRADDLAAAYTRARPRLVRVAYAVLGSVAEAEDVVSDCWPKLAAADGHDRILDVDAWATVAVARSALDTLRSARVRRETYVGPWLPEPIIQDGQAAPDPADRITLDETLRYALLVVLETLTPAERTAWVLHDLFGMTFAEVARTVGRTPAAVRQLAARARTHVQARVPRVAVDPEEHAAATTRFLTAATGGDLSMLLEALDPDVVLTSDGGGVVTAARHPVYGADKVARFLTGLATKFGRDLQTQIVSINAAPGLGVFDRTGLTAVLSFTVDRDRIQRIDVIRAPAKLRQRSDGRIHQTESE